MEDIEQDIETKQKELSELESRIEERTETEEGLDEFDELEEEEKILRHKSKNWWRRRKSSRVKGTSLTHDYLA